MISAKIQIQIIIKMSIGCVIFWLESGMNREKVFRTIEQTLIYFKLSCEKQPFLLLI